MKSRIIGMLRKSTSDYVPDGTRVYSSVDRSREGLIVPELIFTYGDAQAHARKFPRIVRWLVPAVIGRFRSYWTLRNNPSNPLDRAPEAFFQELRDFANSLGCTDVGFAPVPPEYVFRAKDVLFPNAIVLAYPMDKARIGMAPEITAGQEVWRAYYRLGRVVNKIARFLRRRGYSAQAGPALGGDANYVRLAADAGLGWIGHHGMLISPGAGPSQRLATVYTSITNLPFARENPHQWVGEFCTTCLRCVHKCPGNAIHRVKPTMPDGGPKHIDQARCAVPFANTMGCSVCIKECVFFSGDYAKLKLAHEKRLERRTPLG